MEEPEYFYEFLFFSLRRFCKKFSFQWIYNRKLQESVLLAFLMSAHLALSIYEHFYHDCYSALQVDQDVDPYFDLPGCRVQPDPVWFVTTEGGAGAKSRAKINESIFHFEFQRPVGLKALQNTFPTVKGGVFRPTTCFSRWVFYAGQLNKIMSKKNGSHVLSRLA